jgi:urease accessory protein
MNDANLQPWVNRDHVRPARKVGASLEFLVAAGRTILGPQHTPHPFHITRPFHLADDPSGMATLYLQSSSGGLYGDDDLSIDVTARAGSNVHLTTQAAAVVHSARGGRTRQSVRIDVGEDAHFEYVPESMILFEGADLDASVDVILADGAVLMLCDATLIHDPDGGDQTFAAFRNTISISNANSDPLLIERMLVSGADWLIRTCGLPAHGLFIVAGAIDCAKVEAAISDVLSEINTSPSKTYAACAVFPTLGSGQAIVIVRYLCVDGVALSQIRDRVWAAARQASTGQVPMVRRK